MPKVLHDSSKDGVTVFVSNLPYSLGAPEAALRPLFEACGDVVEIRPIFSNRGDFRGYCYVEFKEKTAALRALELDRKSVEGRPMFVSPCVDKSKHPDFKVFRYSTALEKHKLFVSGLPFSCTKEELEEICKAHGTVKDIRLVTNRAGKPKTMVPVVGAGTRGWGVCPDSLRTGGRKPCPGSAAPTGLGLMHFQGLAYVEYENESQASQAVMKMDGMTIKENIIKVAISNPPQRRVPEKPGARKAPGGPLVPRQIYGARSPGDRGLQPVYTECQPGSGALPGVCHCMLVTYLSAAGTQAENGPAPPPAGVTPAAEAPKMSNADFAKLLLRKTTLCLVYRQLTTCYVRTVTSSL
ncbi:hypothetical protein CB1_000253017 [Camelus ferus]|nr:hypothetical protein CB1_000253017 [Camelus ferus]